MLTCWKIVGIEIRGLLIRTTKLRIIIRIGGQGSILLKKREEMDIVLTGTKDIVDMKSCV